MRAAKEHVHDCAQQLVSACAQIPARLYLVDLHMALTPA